MGEAGVPGAAGGGRRAVALASLDLNLLIPLDALLRERSVTRAAGCLGLSQPTLSTALGRLRRHFDDELLTRTGNTYRLTPLAVDLVDRVAGALSTVERVFAGSPDFDPATSEREFTVIASDYAVAVVGQAVTAVLAAEAPSVRLRFVPMRTEVVDGAPESLRAVDGMLLPHGYLPDMPHEDLYEDEWFCLVSADNDRVRDGFTMAHLESLPMVVTFREQTAFTPAVKQLALTGITPRVVAVTESFLATPFLVAGTDRFALVQRRLADRFSAIAGVRCLPCPFPVAPMVEALWWHAGYARDAGHQWLRGAVVRAAAGITTDAGAARAPR